MHFRRFRFSRDPGPHGRSGFSIVELLIAFSILAVSLGVIFDQFMRSNNSAKTRFTRDQARLIAQEELEILKAFPADRLLAWEDAEEFQPVQGSKTFFRSAEIQKLDDGSIEISTTIAWGNTDESGQEFEAGNSVTFSGVRSQ